MRTAPFVIAATLIAASASFAQEKFEPAVKKGDKWVVRSESSLVLNLQVTDLEGGIDGEVRDRHIKAKRTEVRELEFIDEEKGLPTAWKVSFPESKTRQGAATATDAELEARSTDVEGKQYEVHGTDVIPEDTPDEIKGMLRETEGFWALLPRDGKNLNDSWKIPASKLARIVVRGADEDPSADSEVRVTLSEITNQDGSRIAILTLAGTLKVESKQDFQIEFELSGTLRYDLQAQRPVSLEVKGEARNYTGTIRDDRGLPSGRVNAKGSTFQLDVFYSAK